MDRLGRINPILEVLRTSQGRLNKIFIQKERGPDRVGEIIREAKRRSIPCLFVPKQKLDGLHPHHQGG
jgi:tRNA G18 (ribose-2'-O)-methylase SpoU